MADADADLKAKHDAEFKLGSKVSCVMRAEARCYPIHHIMSINAARGAWLIACIPCLQYSVHKHCICEFEVCAEQSQCHGSEFLCQELLSIFKRVGAIPVCALCRASPAAANTVKSVGVGSLQEASRWHLSCTPDHHWRREHARDLRPLPSHASKRS